MRLAVRILKEGPTYVAYAPKLDVASCGRTAKKAKARLKEAVSLYLDELAARKDFGDEFTRIVSKRLAKFPAAEQNRRIQAALRKAGSLKSAKKW